jgi:hypothetical protein
MSSAAPMSSASHDEFSARLNRIKAGQGQSLLMVGQAEQHVIPLKEVNQISRRQEIAHNAMYPASLLGAVLLGMVAVAVSQYIRFQLMNGASEHPDPGTEMLITGGIGIAASFVLSQAFRLTSKEHRSLQGIGVFLMVCAFHNLCHWLPGPMSVAFSADYVRTTIDASPPNSLRFGARYFPLFDSGAPVDPVAADAGLPTAPVAVPEAAPKILPIVRKGGKIVNG